MLFVPFGCLGDLMLCRCCVACRRACLVARCVRFMVVLCFAMLSLIGL